MQIQCRLICDCMHVHAFTKPRCQLNRVTQTCVKEVRPMMRRGHAPDAQTRVRQRLIQGRTCSADLCATPVRTQCRRDATSNHEHRDGWRASEVRRRPRLTKFGAGSRYVAHAIAEPAEHDSLITLFAEILQCDSLLRCCMAHASARHCDAEQLCAVRCVQHGFRTKASLTCPYVHVRLAGGAGMVSLTLRPMRR
jgi:hypothetical protein